MSSLQFISFLFGLFATVRADYPLPQYQVDLQADPHHRYDHIITEKVKKDIHLAIDAFFPPGNTKMQAKEKMLDALLSPNATQTGLLGGPDALAEASGIARLVGVDLRTVVMLSAFYDLTAAKGHSIIR